MTAEPEGPDKPAKRKRGLSRRFLIRAGVAAGALAGVTVALRSSDEGSSRGPRSDNQGAPAQSDARTVCAECPVGCAIVATRIGDDWRSVSGDAASPVNLGRICPKAEAGRAAAMAPRVLEPLQLRDGRWRPLSWQDAIDLIGARLEQVRLSGGPDAVYWMADGRLTNEQAYLTRKLAAFWGTNNIDFAGHNSFAAAEAGLANVWGPGLSTNPVGDLAEARTVLLVGADASSDYPVIDGLVARARSARGTKVCVVDNWESASARQADLYVRTRPGSDVALAWGIVWHLFRKRLFDIKFVQTRLWGFGPLQREVQQWTPAAVERVTGAKPEQVEKLATMLWENRPGTLLLQGAGTAVSNGANAARAWAVVQLVLGNMGQRGGGLAVLCADANAQGVTDMGVGPASLPGYYGLDQLAWKHWARVWDVDDLFLRRRFANTGLMQQPGVPAARWMDAVLAPGSRLDQPSPVRALVSFGAALETLPRLDEAGRAIDRLDLLVMAVDRAPLAATLGSRRDGVVLLPLASPYESEGSVTSLGRTVQWRDRVMLPRGHSLPAEDIVYRLAQRFRFADTMFKNIRAPAGRPQVEDVQKEAARGLVSVGYTGVSAQRLRRQRDARANFDPRTGRHRTSGDYYGLPLPCWNHRGADKKPFGGTPRLFDASLPVTQGGHCFPARFGVERNNQLVVANAPGPKNAPFKLGYGEFFMIHLNNLDWADGLTDAERLEIGRVAGDETAWRYDLSGGIVRVVLNNGAIPSGNGMARAEVWNFPDPVPRQRESAATLRRDLVDAAKARGNAVYPPPDDAVVGRVPTSFGAGTADDSARAYRTRLLVRPLPAGRMAGKDASRLLILRMDPITARRIDLERGGAVRLSVPGISDFTRFRAVVDRTLPPWTVLLHTGFGGLVAGEDRRSRLPNGVALPRWGEPAQRYVTLGFDRITGAAESRFALCRIARDE